MDNIESNQFNPRTRCSINTDSAPTETALAAPLGVRSYTTLNFRGDGTDDGPNWFGLQPPTNHNTPHFSLMVHTDDTFRLVYMAESEQVVIQRLYEYCDWDIEFEKLHFLQHPVQLNKLTSNHDKYLSLEVKDKYVYEYLPRRVQQLQLDDELRDIAKSFVSNPKPTNTDNTLISVNTKIDTWISSMKVSDKLPKNETIPHEINKLLVLPEVLTNVLDTNIKTPSQLDESNSDDDLFIGFSGLVNKKRKLRWCSYDKAYPNVLMDTLPRKRTIYVLINVDNCMKTVTWVNPPSEDIQVIKNNPECGFSILFQMTTDRPKIIEYITSMLDNVSIYPELFYDQLVQIGNNIKILSDSDNIGTDNEETLVAQYINDNYDITNSIGDKIKASVLADIIKTHVFFDALHNPATFTSRVSKYLKKMGLEKKRFNDGFYYYGLVLKHY